MDNMNKVKYISGGGVACIRCGSHNLTAGNMSCDLSFGWDEPLTQPVSCNECGAEWVDVLRPVDVSLPDGGDIKPPIFPLHQIFDWRWIGVMRGTELEIHGPYVAEKLKKAVLQLRLQEAALKMASMKRGDAPPLDRMFEITITEGGHLSPVEVEDETP